MHHGFPSQKATNNEVLVTNFCSVVTQSTFSEEDRGRRSKEFTFNVCFKLFFLNFISIVSLSEPAAPFDQRPKSFTFPDRLSKECCVFETE